MPADCHVRKLRIRTRDKTIMPHMTFLLEDAFRTASFPGIPSNGRVFIKRLDLGASHPSVSSRVLAARIDKRLRRIRPVIISENDKEDIFAPAVWFPDDLSPHRFLLGLLSKNHRPRAWYWQTAIKGWHPNLTRRQSYHLILSRAAEHETGIHGLSFVLEPLFENGNLTDVLDALEPRNTSRLLMGMGLSPVQKISKEPLSIDRRMSPPPPLPVTFRDGEIITRAAGKWSVFDPRFMLASYLILTRIGQKASPSHVNRLLESVSGATSITGKTSDPAMNRTPSLADSAENESSPAMPQAKRDEAGKTGTRTPGNTTPGNDNQGKNLPTRISRNADSGSIAKVNEEKTVPGQGPEKKHIENTLLEEIDSTGSISGTHRPKPEDKPSPASNFSEPGSAEFEQGSPNASKRCRSPQPDPTEIRPLYGGLAGNISTNAGLIFVISLMKRIGMDTLMETFPEYEDLDLPRRILFRCAELAGISGDDPVLEFLGQKPEPGSLLPEFVAPPEWRRILPSPASGAYDFRLGRIDGSPGYRLILDQKERLVIGLWHPGNRDRIKPWIDPAKKPSGSREKKFIPYCAGFRPGCKALRVGNIGHIHRSEQRSSRVERQARWDKSFFPRPLGPAASRTWSLEELVNTIVIAMNRYCRQYASMTLVGLIRRQACIATTKTHLDVTYPFDRLDIRVRMAGLDINPGWVPWLGRVFQFHYVGGEG